MPHRFIVSFLLIRSHFITPTDFEYFYNKYPNSFFTETLPSYEDATKNGVSFFNTVYGQQTVMLPAFGNAPASFNDMPPEYAEIANMT